MCAAARAGKESEGIFFWGGVIILSCSRSESLEESSESRTVQPNKEPNEAGKQLLMGMRTTVISFRLAASLFSTLTNHHRTASARQPPLCPPRWLLDAATDFHFWNVYSFFSVVHFLPKD